MIEILSNHQTMDTKYRARKHSIGLRQRRKPKIRWINTRILPQNQATTTRHIQTCSTKKGLKAFGEAGDNAVVKEMEQLNDRYVIEPSEQRCKQSKKRKKR